MHQQDPEHIPSPPEPGGWTLPRARDWCADYAARHYENFIVASRLLPRQIREAYTALYAFARGADERADDWGKAANGGSRELRLRALLQWQAWLDELYTADPQPAHPAFVALLEVIRHHEIEQSSFSAMIDAFRRDQQQTRYDSWQEVGQYTCGSADPVGRWVLRLHGYRDPELDELSDLICTALQLVNFMQDARTDLLQRDRIYLPLDELRRFGVTPEMLLQAPSPPPVRRLLAFQARRAETFFHQGRELLGRVSPLLRRQLVLFHGGGRIALHNMRRAGYDVGSRHIRVTGMQKAALFVRAMRGAPL